MEGPRGWYSRGYLPHIDGGEIPQFITWRTADSIPAELLTQWKKELSTTSESEAGIELSRRIENYCDDGHGECLLRDPKAARLVQESLFFDHERRYKLHAWVVMPNHVHVMLTPCEGVGLHAVVRSLKAASAASVNRLYGKSGRFWQPDYFDRMIRSSQHFAGTKRYIEWNPVKAKLCTDPARFAWSSARADARARLELVVGQRAKTEG